MAAQIEYRKKKGDIIGNYEIRFGFASGGYGAVYEALEFGTNRLVAIKEIPRNGKADKSAEAEKKILQELKHRNIVELLDTIDSDPGYVYLVYEYCREKDLKTYIDECNANHCLPPWDVCRDMLCQIMAAYDVLRAHKIIYRDFKASNMLATFLSAEDKRRGRLTIKMGDFGTARVDPSNSESVLSLNATIGYASPEVLKGDGKYGYPSDIWGIGMVFYYILHGRRVFNVSPEEYGEAVKKGYYVVDSTLPPVFIDFIDACLQYEQGDRPTWEELKTYSIFSEYYDRADNLKAGAKGMLSLSIHSGHKMPTREAGSKPVDHIGSKAKGLLSGSKNVESRSSMRSTEPDEPRKDLHPKDKDLTEEEIKVVPPPPIKTEEDTKYQLLGKKQIVSSKNPSHVGDYEGEIVNGMANGIGVCTWKDGYLYEGEWKDDKREGKGTLYLNGVTNYEGEWKNDMLDGQRNTVPERRHKL